MAHTEAFRLAIQTARRCSNPRFKTGAVIMQDGEMVSRGWAHVGLRLRTTYATHAEIHALSRATHIDFTEDTCVYIATLRGSRVIYSKPCSSCVSSLLSAGIVRCFYSLESTLANPVFCHARLDKMDNLKTYKSRVA